MSDQHQRPPGRECRPGGCRMWEAEQTISLLQKQLRELMRAKATVSKKNHDLSINLRRAEDRIEELETRCGNANLAR